MPSSITNFVCPICGNEEVTDKIHGFLSYSCGYSVGHGPSEPCGNQPQAKVEDNKCTCNIIDLMTVVSHNWIWIVYDKECEDCDGTGKIHSHNPQCYGCITGYKWKRVDSIENRVGKKNRF